MPWGVVYYRTADGRVPADEFFCRLENGTTEELAERGFAEPQIVVINGMDKPVGQLFSDADYRRHVRRPAGDYLGTFPRRIA